MALCRHETALTRGGRKQFPDRSEESLMSIRHEETRCGWLLVCAGLASLQAHPSLSSSAQARPRYHLFVAFLILP
jgi:hypothetical protein